MRRKERKERKERKREKRVKREKIKKASHVQPGFSKRIVSQLPALTARKRVNQGPPSPFRDHRGRIQTEDNVDSILFFSEHIYVCLA